MNPNTKYYIAGGVLLIIVIILIAYYNKQKADEKKIADLEKQNANPTTEKVVFELPTSPDPSTFGPRYWEAFHTLSAKIPCTGCRAFAEKFVSYWHDLTNTKLKKPLYDAANYMYFNNAIAKLSNGVSIEDAFQINASH